MNELSQADWDILAEHGVTPDGLTFGGSLDLYDTAITQLPDGLTVGGSLDLSGTAITQLPDGLTVGVYLDLSGSAITQLPDGCAVGVYLDLSGTQIGTVLLDDVERKYELRRVPVGDAIWYVAGCRMFQTKQAALDHWGGWDYPDPERGKQYVDAILEAEA